MGVTRNTIGRIGRGLSRVGNRFQNMAVVQSVENLRNIGSLFDFTGTASGVIVTPKNSIELSFVYQCVRVLREAVAVMPGILSRRLDGGGKERATDHPLFDKLRWKPNVRDDAFQLYEYMIVSMLLWGPSYNWINRLDNGTIMDILPLQPNRVQIIENNDFSLSFKHWDRNGKMRLIPADQMLYVRGMSLDGVNPISPITLAAESIGLSISASSFGASGFKNGPAPGLAISLEGGLKPEAAKELKKDLKEQTAGGSNNWHNPLLLEFGAKWDKIPINMEDVQLLETRKFQKNEIAGIFGVPPHMIGAMDEATFSNIEHQNLHFIQASLRPWLTRIEQAIMTQMFDKAGREEFSFEFLIDSLLRADIIARYNAYQKGILTGFMTRNEARILEGLNPLPGLDEPLVPLNVTTVDENGNPQTITVAGKYTDENGVERVMFAGQVMEILSPDYKGAA